MNSNEALRVRANTRPGRAAAWPFQRSMGWLCQQLSTWSWVTHHLSQGLRFHTYEPKAAALLISKDPSSSDAQCSRTMACTFWYTQAVIHSTSGPAGAAALLTRGGSGIPHWLKTTSLSPVTKLESQTLQSTLSPTTNPKEEDQGVRTSRREVAHIRAAPLKVMGPWPKSRHLSPSPVCLTLLGSSPRKNYRPSKTSSGGKTTRVGVRRWDHAPPPAPPAACFWTSHSLLPILGVSSHNLGYYTGQTQCYGETRVSVNGNIYYKAIHYLPVIPYIVPKDQEETAPPVL